MIKFSGKFPRLPVTHKTRPTWGETVCGLLHYPRRGRFPKTRERWEDVTCKQRLRSRPRREGIPAGRWFPISKKLRQTCCRCGLKHTFRFRIRRGNNLEMMLVP